LEGDDSGRVGGELYVDGEGISSAMREANPTLANKEKYVYQK
jgi:hypothetical protein